MVSNQTMSNLRFGIKLLSDNGNIKQVFVVYRDKSFLLPESKWLEFSDAAGWTCREYIEDKANTTLIGKLLPKVRERHILTSAFYQYRNKVFVLSDFETVDLFGGAATKQVPDAPSPFRMRP